MGAHEGNASIAAGGHHEVFNQAVAWHASAWTIS
jgi:hypothetical protein